MTARHNANRRRRFLNGAEMLLWATGIALVAGTLLYRHQLTQQEADARARYQADMNRAAAREQRAAPPDKPAQADVTDKPAPAPATPAVPAVAAPRSLPAPGDPSMESWSAQRIKAFHAAGAADAAPLAVLSIPAIDLEVLVLRGTDETTLDRGAGHITGTARPGETGNIGIAAHRDGYFRALRHIKRGHELTLNTTGGAERYRVDDIRIVAPDDVTVLAPRSRPAVTLVTCYPFYFVGSAPQRFIVHASMLEDRGT